MVDIAHQLTQLQSSLPEHVVLVAVSKRKPNTSILEAYAAGQRVFGENHALEMRDKAEELPRDIRWHFIGHLQRNKVKYVVPYVDLIHSIDSERLLLEVNKEAKKHNKVVAVLLQVKIGAEETKYGLTPEEMVKILTENSSRMFSHVFFQGVMGMATHTDDRARVLQEFSTLRTHFDAVPKEVLDVENVVWKYCSMGMSNDYPVALEAGSNMVRVGSRIFGQRK